MTSKTSITIVLVLIAGFTGPPASADGETGMLLFLSADNLERQSLEEPALKKSDFTPTADLLFTYNNRPWRVLGEFFVTDDEAELERLQIGYEFSNGTTFWVGRFHQPVGTWNYRYHHGAYLQPSISRPSIENWEDEDGVLPAHITGVMIDGWRQLGENSGLRYAASIGLAPVFESGELAPFDILDPDAGSRKAAGSINIAYYPDYVGVSNIGVIGGYAEIEVQPDATLGNITDIRIRQTILGVQANWEREKWHFIGAAYHVDTGSRGTGIQIDGTFLSGYFQALYDLSESTNVYSRIERTRNPETMYLRLRPSYVYRRELLGFRWDFSEQQALNFEISSNRIVEDQYSEFRVQWSATFP